MESSAAKRPTPAYFKPAPSEIQYGRMRFLITDRPSDLTINTYIEVILFSNRFKYMSFVQVIVFIQIFARFMSYFYLVAVISSRRINYTKHKIFELMVIVIITAKKSFIHTATPEVQ